MKKFQLLNEGSNTTYGTMSFNGKFVFTLDPNVDLDTWNRIGFIPVDDSRILESDDLFRHLNSRLPITLRSKSNDEKIDYIEENGLRVASDNFYLQHIN